MVSDWKPRAFALLVVAVALSGYGGHERTTMALQNPETQAKARYQSAVKRFDTNMRAVTVRIHQEARDDK